jgi:predicted RNA methylase
LTSKTLDQFYTNETIAENCYKEILKLINLENYKLIEPSAGTGSFLKQFHNNYIALDLEPKLENIIQQDFFDFELTELNNPSNDKIITIGNPPFGKNSSLAIKFFNKSAKYSDYICMILPKTFKKDSVVNKLDLNFHLIKETILPKNSFVFNEETYDVKCVFQIWKKKDIKRKIIKQVKEILKENIKLNLIMDFV